MAGNRYRGRRSQVTTDVFARVFDGSVWLLANSRKAMRTILIVSMLGSLGYATWIAVQRSPYFLVRHVAIESIPHLSEQDTLARAGLDTRINIFQFDPGAAQRALLQHPWVARAEVKKVLPDRVSIRLSERRPEGILVLGKLYLVDGEGRPFVKVSKDLVGQYPMVTGLSRADFETTPDEAHRMVRNALAVVRMYERTDVASRWPIGSVNLGVGGRVDMMLDQTRVGLGADGFEHKLEKLNRILSQLEGRKMGAEYILFGDDPSRVIVKESTRDTVRHGSLTLNDTGARE